MLVPIREAEAKQDTVLPTAIAIVAFWRTVVVWMIALTSIAIIATLGLDLILIWQTIHHAAG
jgi:hypothetical protein